MYCYVFVIGSVCQQLPTAQLIILLLLFPHVPSCSLLKPEMVEMRVFWMEKSVYLDGKINITND